MRLHLAHLQGMLVHQILLLALFKVKNMRLHWVRLLAMDKEKHTTHL